MKYKIILASLILGVTILFAAIINRKADTSAMVDAGILYPIEAKKAVLVELFTSEGCSSCPPADRLLLELDQQTVAGAEVIALSEHVDYWNRLGWADPFSSSAFSERQSRYSRVFDNDSIYTPQMVVDGREEFVGNNAARARSAIAQAARSDKATITLSTSQASAAIKIHIENLPAITDGDRAEVVLAITEGGLQSNVTRGENSGRRLAHTAVVRSMEVIGSVEGGKSFDREATAQIEKGWNRDQLRAVVFIQERESRRVLGAATVRTNGKP
jgi:hypothetical protein